MWQRSTSSDEIARGGDIGRSRHACRRRAAGRPCRADRGRRAGRRARSRSAANAAPRGLRAPNGGCRPTSTRSMSALLTVGAFMCTVAANSSLEVRPAVIGSTTLSTCTPAARSAPSTAWRSISSAAAMSTTAAALHALRLGMADAEHLDRMGAARQHVLRRARLQPRDHADDLAGADVERRTRWPSACARSASSWEQGRARDRSRVAPFLLGVLLERLPRAPARRRRRAAPSGGRRGAGPPP